MAIGTTTALIGGAAIGGIAGAVPKNSSSESRIAMGPQSQFDQFLYGNNGYDQEIADMEQALQKLPPDFLNPGAAAMRGMLQQQIQQKKEALAKQPKQDGFIQKSFKDYASLVEKGPGEQDVVAGTQAQRDLASMLGDYTKTGGVPGQDDINTSNSLAYKLFGAQREALTQSFTDQRTQFANQAALQGRSSTDPVFATKLAQMQTNQQRLLDAQQGGWATDYSMRLPGQRLAFASDRANVLGGLASQALSNRQAIMALGSQLGGGERNFRLGTGTQMFSGSQGGGVGGFMAGALGGAGAGLGVASDLQSLNKPLSSMNQGTNDYFNRPYQFGAASLPSATGPSLFGGR
jgi:hypothetical protein